MRHRKRNVGVVAAAAITSLLAVPALSSASLIQFAVPGPDIGNSLQAATRILELTSPGASSTESGCVGWNGSADVFTCGLRPVAPALPGGDQQPQTQTRTAGDLGIDGGSDVRIVFDALEPGGDSVTLEALRLFVLDPTGGALIFSADLAAPIRLPSTLTVNGKSDLVLGLAPAQAADFDALVAASLIPLADLRIGLYANLSDSTGEFEGFYVRDTESFGTGDIDLSEPVSLLLIGAGFGLCAWRFRRAASKR